MNDTVHSVSGISTALDWPGKARTLCFLVTQRLLAFLPETQFQGPARPVLQAGPLRTLSWTPLASQLLESSPLCGLWIWFRNSEKSKHVYYLGWNRSPAQAGCMRQALGPGALGRPRGSGWRGRWEGGSGWGTPVNPWLFHFNVWQNSLQ